MTTIPADQLNSCLACGGKNLKTSLDFGHQPLANAFQKEPKAGDKFPLAVNYCQECSHVQLTAIVSREAIFTDYIYVSGTSRTLQKDFSDFASQLTDKHGPGRVLDIACNDGSQLDEFKIRGWETFGIDPAENLHPISSKNHNVSMGFLSDNHPSDLGQFDVVIAQNVVAHTANPLEFLSIASRFGGTLYVQTSQADMISNFQFDTIYHEHVSFFSETSFATLANRANLELVDISKRGIHGGSYLFELRRQEAPILDVPKLKLGFVSEESMSLFTENSWKILHELKDLIYTLRKNGHRVVGYGAAAKAMTILSVADIQLDYIIDDSPHKQGLWTPCGGTPIYSIQALQVEDQEIYLIPLAWNFAEEILARVKAVFPLEVKVITYFPKVSVS